MEKFFLKFGALMVMILFAWVSFATLSMSSVAGEKGCIFMDTQGAVCPMDALSHIDQWKQTFLGVFFPLLVATPAIGMFIFLSFSLIKVFHLREALFSLAWRFRKKSNDLLEAIDFLRTAFSDGILNPKLYHRVTA
ncbi:hypothetical protein HZA43_03850 [Candidatus Peregrinibacteria bacterium]|nr:hypothetical protein [Candidatus Peregrinibacteria bacterium]